MRRLTQLGIVALASALWMPGVTLFAQKGRPRIPVQRRVEPPIQRPIQPPIQRTPAPKVDLPPRWIDRLQAMTPAEQERFLNNNARFRDLPMEQQAQIRQRLQVWNGLSPEQRQTLVERERVLAQMTPEQRRYVRETLMPQWQNMRPARRQAVLGKLRDLRDLSESERAAKLNDESFVGSLSPDERQMLRDLSNLRVGPPPA